MSNRSFLAAIAVSIMLASLLIGGLVTPRVSANPWLFVTFGPTVNGTTPPAILVSSPGNGSVCPLNVNLTFSVSKPVLPYPLDSSYNGITYVELDVDGNGSALYYCNEYSGHGALGGAQAGLPEYQYSTGLNLTEGNHSVQICSRGIAFASTGAFFVESNATVYFAVSKDVPPSGTVSVTYSTPPSVQWRQTYSPGTAAETDCLIQTSDGGYALAGQAMYLYLGAIGPWLLKADSWGSMQWIQPYLSEQENLGYFGANALVQTDDGGYAFAGSLGNSSSNSFYLIKTDFQGNILWRQSYMVGSEVCDMLSVDGGFVLGGTRNDGSFWLAKINSTGALQWSRVYGDKASGTCEGMVQTSDGGFALAGFVISGSFSHALLVRTDSSGSLMWNRTYGDSSSGFQAFSLAATSDGGCLLGGMAVSSNHTVAAVIKTDYLGNVVWNQTYGELGSPAVLSVIQTSDQGYALGCGWFGPSVGNLIKTDAQGNVQWNITCSDSVCAVVQNRDGGFTFAGGFNGDNWLASTSSLPPIPTSTPLPTPTMSQSPNQTSNASTTPAQSPSPTLTAISTVPPTLAPSQPPTQQSTSSPNPTILIPSISGTLLINNIVAAAIVFIAIAAIAVGLLFHFSKHKEVKQ